MNLEWMDQALCRDYGTDLFYPESPDLKVKNKKIRDAKQVCAECPVLAQCDSWATTTREPHGVWGGRYRSGDPKATRYLSPHGTSAAAQRHRRKGEKPCEICLEGERYERQQKRRTA